MSDIFEQDFEDVEAARERNILIGNVVSNEEDRKRLQSYVREETGSVWDDEERSRFMGKVDKWIRQREARPEMAQRTYPWKGASNLVPPIAMMNTNGIFSMMMNSFMDRRPFWTVQGEKNRGISADEAQSLTKLIDIMSESRHHIGLREAIEDIVYNWVSIGTQFVKVPWISERWQFKRLTEEGDFEQVSKMVRNSPGLVPIPIEDFLTRPYWSDIQRAPWIGTIHWLFEHELYQRKDAGIFPDIEQTVNMGSSDLDDHKIKRLQRMGISINEKSGLFPIIEMYVYWDVDGDGIYEDIMVWYDPIADVVLRTELNELGVRPIARMVYLPRPGSLYGIGVGWIMEYIQEEITTLHNMRIDGGHLSTLQMYITKQGSGIPAGTRFRPLKNIPVQNPKEDFIPIKFPDIGYSTLQMEVMAKEYADRATGLPDAMMGFENRATSARTTATGTMFLAQQGGKMFQANQSRGAHGWSEIGQYILFQMVQNKELMEDALMLLDGSDRANVRRILDMSVEDIPTSFRFRVQTTDIEKTEQARRQAAMQLLMIYSKYGESMFQLLPLIFGQGQNVPQEIKLVAMKFFVGATNLMENTFELFGEPDVGDYLPYIEDLDTTLRLFEAMKEQGTRQMEAQLERVHANSREVAGTGGVARPSPGTEAFPNMGAIEGPA